MGRFALYPSLEQRSVLITGGGSGIGAAIVRRFCEQKSRVAFIDFDEASSAGTVEGSRAAGLSRPLFLSCDLRDIEALRRAVGEAAAAHAYLEAGAHVGKVVLTA